MAANLQQRINSSIQAFVAELSALVRGAALGSVQSALGVDAAPSARGPGRPKGSGNARPKASAPGKQGRRSRRSSEDVGAIAARFLAFVKANDGKRLEEISRALKIPTASLKLPAQRLLAAKAVKTTGAKRGTMYHIAGGSRGAPKRKRAAGKVVVRAKPKRVAKRAKATRAKARKKVASPRKAKKQAKTSKVKSPEAASPNTTTLRELAGAISQPGVMMP